MGKRCFFQFSKIFLSMHACLRAFGNSNFGYNENYHLDHMGNTLTQNLLWSEGNVYFRIKFHRLESFTGWYVLQIGSMTHYICFLFSWEIFQVNCLKMEVFIDEINTIFVEGEGSGSSTFSFRLLGWSFTLQIIIDYRRSTNTLCIVRQCTTVFILKKIASSHWNISLSGVYKFNYKIIVLSQIFDPEISLFVL